MDFNIDKIKALADLAAEKNLAEVTLSEGEQSITIKTAAAFPPSYQTAPAYMLPGAGSLPALPHTSSYQAPAVAGTQAAAPAAAPTEEASLHLVTSPMVGTYYQAASPDAEPFVKVGDTVKVGQTLCILEAMKQMNELESDVAGTITEIVGINGQPVEYGQVLFKVKV